MRSAWLLLVLLPGLTACAGSGRHQVMAGAYPFAWVAQQVAGPGVHVIDLVRSGAEPHDIELTPRQVGEVQEAGLVVYLKGFQPAVDDAVGGGRQGLDLGPVAGQRGSDPHVWLDPVRLEPVALAVADRLARLDPAHASGYRTRAAATVTSLKALDAELRAALQGCSSTYLVTSHAAFGYLASRYGLVQKAIGGLNPDAEPSPRDLADVVDFARAHHVTTVFSESLVSPKIARIVAGELGARTAVLDPVEAVRGHDDYLSVMRRNAAALHRALGCA